MTKKPVTKGQLKSALLEVTAALTLALCAIEDERGHAWWQSKIRRRGIDAWQAEQQYKRLTRRMEFICDQLGLKPIPLPSERDGAKIRASLANDLASIRRRPRK
jgi:hypothetical protein